MIKIRLNYRTRVEKKFEEYIIRQVLKHHPRQQRAFIHTIWIFHLSGIWFHIKGIVRELIEWIKEVVR